MEAFRFVPLQLSPLNNDLVQPKRLTKVTVQTVNIAEGSIDRECGLSSSPLRWLSIQNLSLVIVKFSLCGPVICLKQGFIN
jgi:hypothetical protein